MRDVLRRAALAAVKVLLRGVETALFDGRDPEHATTWGEAQTLRNASAQARQAADDATAAREEAARAAHVVSEWLRKGIAAQEASSATVTPPMDPSGWPLTMPTVTEARAMLATLDGQRRSEGA